MRFISRLLGDTGTPRVRPVSGGSFSDVHLHPAVDVELVEPAPNFSGGTLRCRCEDAPVVVEVSEQVTHSRLCGCTRCWKPDGALFAYVGFVNARRVNVVSGAEKLDIVDPSMPIRRRACIACDTHLFGVVEDKSHAFHRLALVHPDRSEAVGWALPEFASYCSSLIEAGTRPNRMSAIRARIEELGLVPHDCLSPELMDRLATQRARQAGTLS